MDAGDARKNAATFLVVTAGIVAGVVGSAYLVEKYIVPDIISKLPWPFNLLGTQGEAAS